jgi:hypothetical protein
VLQQARGPPMQGPDSIQRMTHMLRKFYQNWSKTTPAQFRLNFRPAIILKSSPNHHQKSLTHHQIIITTSSNHHQIIIIRSPSIIESASRSKGNANTLGVHSHLHMEDLHRKKNGEGSRR